MNIIISIIISTLFLIGSIFLYKKIGLRALYIIISIAGLFAIFTLTIHQHDEAAHFDYISRIADENRLATTNDSVNFSLNTNRGNFTIKNYEAFQPPFYYLIVGGLSKILNLFTKDLLTRLYFVRICSLIFLLTTIFIIIKTYQLLIEKNIIKKDNLKLFLISLMFLLIPGIYWIQIISNNDALTILLVSLFYYYFIKLIFLEKIEDKQIRILSILMGIMLLTKLTLLYLLPIPIIFFIFKKEYKKIPVYIMIVTLMVLPWLMWNINAYGHLIATKEHIQIVGPILNPRNSPYSLEIFKSEMTELFKNFWFGFTKIQNKLQLVIVNIILNLLLISSFILLIYKTIKNIKIKDKLNNNLIIILFILPIIGNYTYLLLISILNLNRFFSVRFFYPNLLAFIFVFYIFNKEYINEKYSKILNIIYIISIISLSICFFYFIK